jgi:hypothetical protein
LFTFDLADGADLGVAVGDGVRRDVAFRAGAFRALAFAAREGAALREVFTVLRGARSHARSSWLFSCGCWQPFVTPTVHG